MPALKPVDLRDLFNGSYESRSLIHVNAVVHHHIGVPSLGPIVRFDEQKIASIHEYHVETHGWPGIGYHFVISQKEFYYVGDLRTLRYHVAGRNLRSVGVLWLGDFTDKLPTPMMRLQWTRLSRWLRGQIGDRWENFGHSDYAVRPTACPGEHWSLEGPIYSPKAAREEEALQRFAEMDYLRTRTWALGEELINMGHGERGYELQSIATQMYTRIIEVKGLLGLEESR
jgi:hypothetical protein